MLRIGPTLLAMLLVSSLQLSAQDLGRAATRERARRGLAVAGAPRSFSDEDLRQYVGQRPPEAVSQLPSDPTPATSGPHLDGTAPRLDVYGRHVASAEAYMRQCEDRLRAAKESWLSVSETSPPGAATQARRAVENAEGALERARAYHDQAEVAARAALSMAMPAALP